jgi:hypothetical protein
MRRKNYIFTQDLEDALLRASQRTGISQSMIVRRGLAAELRRLGEDVAEPMPMHGGDHRQPSTLRKVSVDAPIPEPTYAPVDE